MRKLQNNTAHTHTNVLCDKTVNFNEMENKQTTRQIRNDCGFFDRNDIKKNPTEKRKCVSEGCATKSNGRNFYRTAHIHGRGIHRIPLICIPQPQKENKTYNNSLLFGTTKEYQATKCSMSMFTVASKTNV